MAIDIINGFHVGATAPIDDRFLLSKAQMLAFNDNIAPQSFLCCCADDNKVYQYTKTNTADVTTGKFRIFESGGSDKVVFLDLPAQEDWEDEEVTRVFYNSLKSAIDDGKYVVVVETSEGDFDCWLYYTVAYNVVGSDDEFIGLQVFDGIYTDAITVTPTNITITEREVKSDIEIEFDKTDINSVYDQLFSNFITANPVLFEEVEHADYYWKFINAESAEDTGEITGFVFMCSKHGELHKLTIRLNDYEDTVISPLANALPYDDITFDNPTISGNVYTFTIDNERCQTVIPDRLFINYNDSGEYATILRQSVGGEWVGKLIDEDDVEMDITYSSGQLTIECSDAVGMESITFEYDESIAYTDEGKNVFEKQVFEGLTTTDYITNDDNSPFILLTSSNQYLNVIKTLNGFSDENIPITREGFLSYGHIANLLELFYGCSVFITDDIYHSLVTNNNDIIEGFDIDASDDGVVLSYTFNLSKSVRKYTIYITIEGCEYDSNSTHILSADSINLYIAAANSRDNRHVIIGIQKPNSNYPLRLKDEYSSFIPSILVKEREFCIARSQKISAEKALNDSADLKYTAFNDLGTITDDVTLTFDEIAIDKYVEYNGRFTTDATHTVTFPAGVVMTGNTSQKANTTYEFSIVNGYGIILEVVTTGGETQPFAMIDDTNVSTSSAYSSSKIDELIGDIETLLEAL